NGAQGREDFSTLSTKGAVLRAMGREAEADSTMERAIHLPGATAATVYQYGMALLRSGRTDRALEIFTANRKQYPDEPFWTYLGLARGYTASGDTKNAIANWQIALRHVPPFLATSVPGFQEALKALQRGQ
ncbi:MAG TPA: tetratricopeptide repeat protein, partial [Gemmatimonadales bacterium]|nr:tetratricopeptide repeat protein [Gemmatimonadales bacterium]